jgi:hypothetical protein
MRVSLPHLSKSRARTAPAHMSPPSAGLKIGLISLRARRPAHMSIFRRSPFVCTTTKVAFSRGQAWACRGGTPNLQLTCISRMSVLYHDIFWAFTPVIAPCPTTSEINTPFRLLFEVGARHCQAQVASWQSLQRQSCAPLPTLRSSSAAKWELRAPS